MPTRICAVAALVLLATIATATASGRAGWTSAQLEQLRSMSLAELEAFLRTLSGPVVVGEPAPGRRTP